MVELFTNFSIFSLKQSLLLIVRFVRFLLKPFEQKKNIFPNAVVIELDLKKNLPYLLWIILWVQILKCLVLFQRFPYTFLVVYRLIPGFFSLYLLFVCLNYHNQTILFFSKAFVSPKKNIQIQKINDATVIVDWFNKLYI